jgi:hypothetical protein
MLTMYPSSARTGRHFRSTGMAGLLLAVSTALVGGSRAAAQTPFANGTDYQAVAWVSRVDADRWLKEQVEQSRGDFAHERYRFIIGFSTSHFGFDPVNAIAMRRMAFSFLNNTFAAGDVVLPVAWEMDVWSVGEEIPLTADARSRARFVDAVPYAPMEGTRGGHDVERSLYSTLLRAVPVEKSNSTIVLLLTNSNQSQVPPRTTEQLFGANNRRLLAALRERGYRPLVRKSFTARTATGKTTVDVTAVFPARLEGLPGTPRGPRYPTFPVESWQPAGDRPTPDERLPNPAAPLAPAPAPARTTDRAEQDGFPWPLLLVALVGLAAVLAILLRRRGRATGAVHRSRPAGRPLPGTIELALGSDPDTRRFRFPRLTTACSWRLSRHEGEQGFQLHPLTEDAVAAHSDAGVPRATAVGAQEAGPAREQGSGKGKGAEKLPPDPLPGETPVAVLRFEAPRSLVVEADTVAGTVFEELAGRAAAACGPRRLVVAPEQKLLARMKAVGTSTRLEIIWRKG